MTPITLIKSGVFRTGGLEKYTWQLAADFCALGHPVTLLTTGEGTPRFTHPLLQIVSLPVHHALSVLSVLHFDRACHAYLGKNPTDVVFSLDRNRFQTHIRAGNGVHAAYLQRRTREEGILKGLEFRLNPLHRAILSLEKKGFENPALHTLFTNSEMVKQEVLRSYQVDPQKIVAIHNGVEWHAMQKAFDGWQEGREQVLARFGLDPNAHQFLFIGHNFRRKGLDKLLHALKQIKDRPFQLCVVGADKHAAEFQHKAEKLGSKVFFAGAQNDPLPFYQMADHLVIPSLYDPFANVTVEALAMGVPVISSRHNGGHEVLTALSGVVIEELDDGVAFARLLEAALSKPKTVERARAVRHSAKHLDFSNQLRQITKSTVFSRIA